MAAAFELTLDTSAPMMEHSGASITGEAIRLPYSVNEPGIVDAFAIRFNGEQIDGSIESDRLLFLLDAPWEGGTLEIRTKDDVWNERAYSILLPRAYSTQYRVKVWDLKAWIPMEEDGGVREPFTRVRPLDSVPLPPGEMRAKRD